MSWAADELTSTVLCASRTSEARWNLNNVGQTIKTNGCDDLPNRPSFYEAKHNNNMTNSVNSDPSTPLVCTVTESYQKWVVLFFFLTSSNSQDNQIRLSSKQTKFTRKTDKYACKLLCEIGTLELIPVSKNYLSPF